MICKDPTVYKQGFSNEDFTRLSSEWETISITNPNENIKPSITIEYNLNLKIGLIRGVIQALRDHTWTNGSWPLIYSYDLEQIIGDRAINTYFFKEYGYITNVVGAGCRFNKNGLEISGGSIENTWYYIIQPVFFRIL